MKYNPFLITGYKSTEYFCDRVIESDKLRNALENQRNITLISSRPMGKTGLIRHVFNQLSNNSTIVPIYFDIMTTTGFAEFVEVFSNAMLLSLSKSQSRWKEVWTIQLQESFCLSTNLPRPVVCHRLFPGQVFRTMDQVNINLKNLLPSWIVCF